MRYALATFYIFVYIYTPRKLSVRLSVRPLRFGPCGGILLELLIDRSCFTHNALFLLVSGKFGALYHSLSLSYCHSVEYIPNPGFVHDSFNVVSIASISILLKLIILWQYQVTVNLIKI